jgi:hypothetical protein
VDREHIAEHVARGELGHVRPDRSQQARHHLLVHEPLPVLVVLVDVVLEVVIDDRPVIAPRVPAEELITAGAGQHDLAESAGELGRVEVGVRLADPKVFQMPDQPWQHTLHVAGLEDHLVVLRAEEV